MIDDPAISELRQRIDTIDSELLKLLAERIHVVHQVGDRKREKGIGVFDPAREDALLKRLASQAPQTLDDQAIANIFRAIVAECRRLEGEKMEAQSE